MSEEKQAQKNKPNENGQKPRQNNGDSPDKRQNNPKRAKTLVMWVLLIMLSMVFVQFFSRERSDELQINYTSFRQHLVNDNIRAVTISDKTIVGELINGVSMRTSNGQDVTENTFKVSIPFEDPDLVLEMEQRNVDITARPLTTHWLSQILGWFPYLIFIAFWIFIFRQMQGGGQKGLFSFGKSKAKLADADRPSVKFSDVAGVEEAKRDLQEIVEFLKEPAKFTRFGARLPKGALLLGPPGTGKTLLARAVAGEADVPFFSMSGSDFVEMFVGVGASRVRDLFEQGKKNAPCIIFIDEMDAVGRHRGAGLGGGHDEREQTLNQLLVEMDGFGPSEGIILIAATNRPDVLDPALLRPGRFDRHISVDKPDVRGREAILRIKSNNKLLAESVNMKTLAKLTPGMSGADLENVVNEAALRAAREDHTMITMEDLERAKDKIVMGSERKLVLSEKERKVIAYHETGHTIIFQMIPEIYTPHSVTIISRGRALGVTYSLPDEDHYLYSKNWCLGQITSLLAGQAAELMVMGDTTNGASDDINRATDIARHMVCDWGMSEIGPLALGNKNEEIFLGRELTQSRDYSDQTAVKIDYEMRQIIQTCRHRAETILKDNEELMHRMADALLEYETLNREQISRLVSNEPLEPMAENEEPVVEQDEPTPDVEHQESMPSNEESASAKEVQSLPADSMVKDEPTSG
jgi:cell division protease FtsH